MQHWAKIADRFTEWTAPLRPSAEDVQMFADELPTGSKTLLLGVTTELQGLADIAIDNNPRMIEVMGGRAVLGDWSDLPFENEFDAVIGDGSLNVFQFPPELLFNQVRKALKKRGKFILRVFSSPEEPEELDFVLTQKQMGFHAFKWRVAHAIANPYVPVAELYRVIKPVYDHSTLEVYQHSDLTYYFPKLSQLPRWDRIQFAKSYELAERCPVISWNFLKD